MAKTGLSYREVFDVKLLNQAHGQCKGRVECAMLAGASVIAVTNTNISSKYIKAYEELAAEYDYKVFYLTVERAHSGDNGHKVPSEAISGMAARWEWIDPEFKKEFIHNGKQSNYSYASSTKSALQTIKNLALRARKSWNRFCSLWRRS